MEDDTDTAEWAAKIEALPRSPDGALNGLDELLKTFRRHVRSEWKKDGEKEQQLEPYIALKCANRRTYSYETARTWAEQGMIMAKKVRGRWYVLQSSMNEHLHRLGRMG